jgi:HlyD family secretion protein
MKKFFYILSVVIILISIYIVLQPKPIAVESVVVQRGVFDETLTIEGKIRSRDKQTVYAFATGNIEGLKIKVGDTVTKGQVVTRLDWDHVFLVKSPISGVVSQIFRESAGPIIRGEPIFEVSNLANLEVVVDLLTPEAIRLRPEGKATILNWGGEGELLAEISQVSRAGAVKISALGVEEERTEVRLSFQKIPSELKSRLGDNYHVDVVFLISREPDILTVPLGALFKSGEQWAVYLVDGNKVRLKELTISKKNDRQAMVTEGLSEGDRVVLFPGDKIHEGSLVKLGNSN